MREGTTTAIEVTVKFQVNKEVKKYGEKFGFVSTSSFHYLKGLIRGRKEEYISNYGEEESQEHLLLALSSLPSSSSNAGSGGANYNMNMNNSPSFITSSQQIGMGKEKYEIYQIFEKKQLTQDPSSSLSSFSPSSPSNALLLLLIEVGEMKATQQQKKQRYQIILLPPSKFSLSRVILQAHDLPSLSLLQLGSPPSPLLSLLY